MLPSGARVAQLLILHPNRLSPSPFKLLVYLFIWVIPYLIVANYLERALMPLRFLCYSQSDLLSTLPQHRDFDTCLTRFFHDRTVDPNCQMNKYPTILINPSIPKDASRILVIRTVPSSLNYRSFIRKTWKPTVESFTPVVFVCGQGKGDEALKEEAEEYQDILQFDFTESYHNLPWKMTSIYSYVLQELPSVDHIIVSNDDTIVNATGLRSMDLGPGDKSWMIGKVSRGYPRLFMPWLPWHVPGEMYPGLCYPRFIQGSSFILSRAAARDFVNNICRVPYVQLDDIFTGILTNCLGLEQIHNSGFDKHDYMDFIVFHYQYSRYSPEYLSHLWETQPIL